MDQKTSKVHIESTRLLINPFSASDADEAFACITSTLTRFMSWDPPDSREDFDSVWRSWLSTIDDGTDYVFAIRHISDSSFLGLVGLHHLRSVTPELGIWIREDRHLQGFGREAVGLIAQWASQEMDVTSFIYPVAEDNRPSRLIAESLNGVIVDRCVTRKYNSVVYRIPSQHRSSD
ncbi:GNAT family N-acetyltransferase [uncultured Deefgea sp.]|uniref:GNAT family N-acetyltransferase n=1 Tax=uncultured Deefgea sp. TaxID=1304914 RepID=UPI0026177F18|nr:GNAT family N-acetyltransferase [uncultured Deefgea sp.]